MSVDRPSGNTLDAIVSSEILRSEIGVEVNADTSTKEYLVAETVARNIADSTTYARFAEEAHRCRCVDHRTEALSLLSIVLASLIYLDAVGLCLLSNGDHTFVHCGIG